MLALLDDIATILDDVAVMSKVAAKKTAGVLGDDLALNAQQVSGVNPDRELPVVWAVAKGSFMNKAILVPAALAISAFVPWAIMPLLMIGGAFLCYEGFEKLAHKFLHSAEEDASTTTNWCTRWPTRRSTWWRWKRTRSRARSAPTSSCRPKSSSSRSARWRRRRSASRWWCWCAIALVMTVGVYGLVAGIVKLDDVGLYLSKNGQRRAARRSATCCCWPAPKLMKTLSVRGHRRHVHGRRQHPDARRACAAPYGRRRGGGGRHGAGASAACCAAITPTLIDAVAGLIAGGLVLLVVTLIQRMFKREKVAAH